jgi:hypothetical protein
MKGKHLMQQFLPVRRVFLIAALAFVLDAVLATAVAIQLNLSDPGIGPGTARDTWFLTGTPISAPGVFMIVYIVFALLATRQRWGGVVGMVGVTLLTLVSGLSLTSDWGMLVRALGQHLTVLMGLAVGIYFLALAVIVISGIATLVLQWRGRSRAAVS